MPGAINSEQKQINTSMFFHVWQGP